MANRITLLLFGLGFYEPTAIHQPITDDSALRVANVVTYSYPFKLVEVLGNMLICYI